MLNRLKLRLRGLFRKAAMERELDEELRFHLEKETEQNLARGMSPEEARYAALRSFGGVERVKEGSRDVRGVRFVEELVRDLRYGARVLARAPGFTVVAVLSLAIGVGANTAIFSVVDGVLLRGLPYPEPDRLVCLWQRQQNSEERPSIVSPGNVTEWRQQAESFSGVASYFQTASVFTDESEAEMVAGARVSANLFPVLGVEPMLGRNFQPEENQRGNDRVVLLSHSLWQRRFGGDEGLLGQTVILDHKNSYTVVGVMPPGVTFPPQVGHSGQSEFWAPLTVTDENRHDMRHLRVIARLRNGVSQQQVGAELKLINERLEEQSPKDYRGWEAEAVPLLDSIVGAVQLPLLLLLGAVAFVLLIACANVANLLLARAASRRREMAMRSALGASRGRLVRQMLTESALLATAGGAGGLLLARLLVWALVSMNPPNIPRLNTVQINGRVLGFTLLISLVVGILFGMVPALQLARTDVNEALKGDGAQSPRGGLAFRRPGFRGMMVVAQSCLALVLLAGAGLMIKSFLKLRQVDLGFDPSHAVVMTISPAFNRFPEGQRTNSYYGQVLEALDATPGVVASAAVTGAPLGGAFMNSPILIPGRAPADNPDEDRVFFSVVSPDYFRAIGATLKRGRPLAPADVEGAKRVAVINETMARTFFPDGDPLGRQVSVKSEADKPYEIVGVVADIKQFGVDKETKPNIYLSLWQKEVAFMNLIVRTRSDPQQLLPELRERIRAVDKYAPVTRVRTLEQVASDSVAQSRFYMLLLALFATVAVTLATVGLYGVMSYSVGQRTKEIGVRLALGARPRRIKRMVVCQGLTLTAIGAAAGLAAAFALTRLLESLLFGVSATDPLTFICIALLLVAVSLLACYLPARRAARVDPMVALRYE